LTGATAGASFIDGPRGRLLTATWTPLHAGERLSCVMIVAPFAEEMNKCRRMMAMLARQAALDGRVALIPDLYGTGDSDGDFSDADCDTWVGDLCAVESWAAERGWIVDAVVGVRAGCLLASRYARSRSNALGVTAFWQPVHEGARMLDQFMRMRVAASQMDGSGESLSGLRTLLASGETVHVSGYGISAAMGQQLSALKLVPEMNDRLGQVHWFEVKRSEESALPQPSRSALEQLNANGINAHLHAMVGDQFWASTEIVCDQALVAATARVLRGGSA
jgi:exosortase A-associated hydrolase 2